MRVLIAPAHINLNPSYGSEALWVWEIISRLAKNFDIQIDAVRSKTANLSLASNIRIYKVGFGRGDLLNGSVCLKAL